MLFPVRLPGIWLSPLLADGCFISSRAPSRRLASCGREFLAARVGQAFRFFGVLLSLPASASILVALRRLRTRYVCIY
jgi:hypothetical protein